MVVVFAGQRLRRTHRAGQSWLARRCARILFCYWTWQVSNAQKFLTLALSRWEGIEKDLKLASEKRREAIQRGDKEEERKWEQQRKEAIEEFDKAREEATKAREELEKAESTAPLQAGDAFALLRVQFVQSTSFASWGHALLSARIPLFVKLFSLCWLAALRGVACFALALQVAVALF